MPVRISSKSSTTRAKPSVFTANFLLKEVPTTLKKDYFKNLSKELHKRGPVINNIQTRTVQSLYVDDIWSCDLADMGASYTSQNHGYRYLLNIVDVFSRYAWSFELRNKTGKSVVAAFKKTGLRPHAIWCDEGKEFYNKDVENWIAPGTVYSTHGYHKSCIVERFNRTLKEKLSKVLTANNSVAWSDYVPDIITEYNSTVHSTTKQEPLLVHEGKMYPSTRQNPHKRAPQKFKVGDIVRIFRKRDTFEKGAKQFNWSHEPFQVREVDVPSNDHEPIVYRLRDSHEDVVGHFYQPEIQKINPKYNGYYTENIEHLQPARKK
jgi:hypothetical protein